MTGALLCRGAELENFTLTLVAEKQEVPISLAVTSDLKMYKTRVERKCIKWNNTSACEKAYMPGTKRGPWAQLNSMAHNSALLFLLWPL